MLGVVPLAALGMLFVLLVVRRPDTRAAPVEILATAVPLLALGWRRRSPEAVLSVALAGWIVVTTAGDVGAGAFAPAVALYTIGTLRSWKSAATAWAVSVLAAVVGTWLVAPGAFGPSVAAEAALSDGFLFGTAAGAGMYMATHRAYVRALLDRTERLERERRLLARQAVADERVRIARELHDVVAHHVSVMVVQAGGAEEVLADDAPAARAALMAIRTTGREALADMRRLLDVLRAEDDTDAVGASRAPQPGLLDVTGLVERARLAGLQVRVRRTGAAVPLPAAVDLTAFRILQEALTNALRHAGSGASVEVEIRFDPAQLEMEVTSQPAAPWVPTSAGAATVPHRPGHGLVGMRERALLLGGEFEAGPRARGGFLVRARLPLEEEAV